MELFKKIVSSFLIFSSLSVILFFVLNALVSPDKHGIAQRSKNNNSKRSPSSINPYLNNFDSQNLNHKACQQLTQELIKAGHSLEFHSVKIAIRDAHLIQKGLTEKELKNCFTTSKMGTINLDIEAFNSDTEKNRGQDLQMQVSVFDYHSQNKIDEISFFFDLSGKAQQRIPATSESHFR